MRFEITGQLECMKKCLELFLASDKEIGERDPLSLDVSLYAALEKGASFCVIAYSDRGEVAGVASIIVARDPHHDRIKATNDTLYVRPPFRRTTLPGRLLVFCEREARARGAASFQWATQSGSDFERALARREAYRRRDVYFEKEL